MSEEKFELEPNGGDDELILYYFGELSLEDREKLDKRLKEEPRLRSRCEEISAFLGALPKSLTEVPAAGDWSRVSEGIKFEIERENARRRFVIRTKRLRMLPAAAVYLILIGLGFYWWGAMTANPSPVVLQVYAPETLTPGSEATMRVIARLRNPPGVTQEFISEIKEKYIREEPSGGEITESSIPAPPTGAEAEKPARQKDEADEDAAGISGVIPETEYHPPVRYAPDVEELIRKGGWRAEGLLDDVPVRITLISDTGRKVLYKGKTGEHGTLERTFQVPREVGDGTRIEIEARYRGKWQTITSPIRVEHRINLLLTHDKPYYQPGQTIHLRALARYDSKRGVAPNTRLVFKVEAPDGTKLFREEKTTSKWGIASAEFVLADVVELGEYTLKVTLPGSEASATVTVDRYVLPQIEVKFEPDSRWVAPGGILTGEVKASYPFGKPVTGGRVGMRFTYFEAEEVEAGTVSGVFDREGAFRFSQKVPERFFGFTPYESISELFVEIEVTDRAGQSRTVYKTVPVSKYPYTARLFPEGGLWHRGVENYVLLTISTLDNVPAEMKSVRIEWALGELTPKKLAPGLYSGLVPAEGAGRAIRVSCRDEEGNLYQFFYSDFDLADSQSFIVHTNKVLYKVGETVRVNTLLPLEKRVAFLDAIRGNQIVFTKSAVELGGRAEFEFVASPAMVGELTLRGYTFTDSPEESDALLRDSTTIIIEDERGKLNVALDLDRASYEPGESAKLGVTLSDASGNPKAGAVGLAAIDKRLLLLGERHKGLANVYYSLLVELMEPGVEVHPGNLSLVGASLPTVDEVFEDLSAELGEVDEKALKGSLEYTRQSLLKVLSAKDTMASEEPDWYPISRSTALDEIERIEKRKSKTQEAINTGVPLIILSLIFLVFIVSLIQHAAFKPAKVSRDLWRNYRALAVFVVLPAFLIPLTFFSFFHSVVLIVSITVFGIISSLVAAFFISEKIDLYRLKSLLAASVYTVTGIWAYLMEAGAIDISPSYPPVFFFFFFTPIILPVLFSMAFLSNNLEHPLTGNTYTTSQYYWKFAVIALVLSFVAALFMPNFMRASGRRGDVAALGGLAEMPALEGADEKMAMTRGLAEPLLSSFEGEEKVGDGEVRVRKRFPETLLWLPELIVDEGGSADYVIELADSITTWQLTATANDASGNLSSAREEIPVASDFFIDFNLPVELTRGDKVSAPVVVYNYFDSRQSITVALSDGEWFSIEGPRTKSITLGSGEVGSVSFPITAKSAGEFKISASARSSSGSRDALERDIIVVPDGKAFSHVENGRLLEGGTALLASLPSGIVPGSGKVILKVYPGAFSQVVDGLEGIFQMPFGCFEQTSSTTYPNVMALSYLQESGQANPALELEARELINQGYQRLVTFEVDGGGFDWFGEAPADLLLTSYGLMEFVDMAEVSYVDPDLIERTRRWIQEQAEPGTGLFEGSGRWYEAIGGASTGKLAINSYVIWALARAGVSRGEFFNAVNYIKRSASNTNDPYALALAVNALIEIGDESEALTSLVERLVGMAEEEDDGPIYWASGTPTFTHAGGNSADVELTAIAVLALIERKAHSDVANKALDWLVKKKLPGGTWGSTQATVLALKALLAASSGQSPGEGSVIVKAGGEEAARIELGAENAGVVHLVDLSDYLGESRKLDVEIEASDAEGIFYQLETRYNLPWEELREAPVVTAFDLKVEYGRTELSVDDSVMVEVTAAYRGPGGTGMVLIDLGIPPGFDLWSPDLDELAGSGVIEKWERAGRRLIVYLRGMERDETIILRYRLKALFPVEAVTGESRIYEYYDPDNEKSTKPIMLRVV